MSKPRILIVEDEKLIRWSLRSRLEEEGHEVAEAESGERGLKMIEERPFDLLILDYRLPDTTGLEIMRQVRQTDPDVVVLMMTAYSNIEDAVEAMRLGAYDYITKPFRMDALSLTVQKALETTRLKRELRDLRAEMRERFGFDRVLGRCPAMLRLYQTIKDVAASGASTIFLRGESGTGKDLAAKTIHYNSERAARPFMNITCTAISETLLESELFGHERGAFTDARAQKKGLLELADGGTVFLDEVGDMPPALQAKLLRFLEEKTFRRVGGVAEIIVDARVIAATNRDLEQLIAAGKFREDLFYRLNIVPIFLPPLRERGDDVILLAEHFIALYAKEFRRPLTGLSPDAAEALMAYTWPGNVRELRNAIERAVLLAKHPVLQPEDFVLSRTAVDTPVARLPPGGIDFKEVEKQLIEQALAATGNNRAKAAKLLRLSRDQLRYRMERYDVEKGEEQEG